MFASGKEESTHAVNHADTDLPAECFSLGMCGPNTGQRLPWGCYGPFSESLEIPFHASGAGTVTVAAMPLLPVIGLAPAVALLI